MPGPDITSNMFAVMMMADMSPKPRPETANKKCQRSAANHWASLWRSNVISMLSFDALTKSYPFACDDNTILRCQCAEALLGLAVTNNDNQ